MDRNDGQRTLGSSPTVWHERLGCRYVPPFPVQGLPPTPTRLIQTVANAMSISVSRNQVRERYGVLLPSAKKGLWTAEEDGRLLAALGDADPLKIPWARIAKSVSGRNGKQCRDRCVKTGGLASTSCSLFDSRQSELTLIFVGRLGCLATLARSIRI